MNEQNYTKLDQESARKMLFSNLRLCELLHFSQTGTYEKPRGSRSITARRSSLKILPGMMVLLQWKHLEEHSLE
jgi:hypothetical protein